MSNKGERNKILREQLGNFCYLRGTIAKNNPLTIHEIIPQRFNGKRIYVNTALLCRLEHDYNNAIELERPKFGNELADYYHYIRESRDLEALRQMREEVMTLITKLGYKIDNSGKILTLRKNKHGR